MTLENICIGINTNTNATCCSHSITKTQFPSQSWYRHRHQIVPTLRFKTCTNTDQLVFDFKNEIAINTPINVNYWKGFNGAKMIIFVCHSSGGGGDKIGVACICGSVCFVKTRRTPAPNAPLTADWSNIHHLGEANTHPNFSTPSSSA